MCWGVKTPKWLSLAADDQEHKPHPLCWRHSGDAHSVVSGLRPVAG
jgi:hypothetical protein